MVDAGFHDNRVVALLERAILDKHVSRRFDIDAVGILQVGENVEAANGDVFAAQEMYRPERRLADFEAFQPHALAAVELHQRRTHQAFRNFPEIALFDRRLGIAPVGKALFRRIVSGIFLSRQTPFSPAAFDLRRERSFTRDGDVRAAECVDERGISHAFHALETSAHGGQAIFQIFGKYERCSLGEMQFDIAAKMERACRPFSGRHFDNAAALRRRLVDQGLEGGLTV